MNTEFGAESWVQILELELKCGCNKKNYDQPRQCVKKQRHYFANKDLSSQSYCFSSGHIWMCELDHKEEWVLKNWCFGTVVLEKILKSPLDCKEIQPILKEINPEYSLEGLMLKLQILWPPDCKEQIHWERPWYWERLKAGEGGNRGWDGWMASSTQWTWVWANSGRWWRTGKPGVLQPMGSQKVGHDLAIE